MSLSDIRLNIYYTVNSTHLNTLMKQRVTFLKSTWQSYPFKSKNYLNKQDIRYMDDKIFNFLLQLSYVFPLKSKALSTEYCDHVFVIDNV